LLSDTVDFIQISRRDFSEVDAAEVKIKYFDTLLSVALPNFMKDIYMFFEIAVGLGLKGWNIV